MGIKEIGKKLAVGASVALATAGLSTCNNNGAVDPAPPPLDCSTVADGTGVSVTGSLSTDATGASTLTVELTNDGNPASWATGATITDFAEGTLVSISPDVPALTITLKLNAGTTAGSFTFNGALDDFRGTSCPVTRTFHFAIGAGNAVEVTERSRDVLPLGARHAAGIGVLKKDGMEVLLEARTPYRGNKRIEWKVTGGEVLADEGGQLRWRLPDEPGIYQVELVIDYGPDGFGFNTKTFEVA